MKGDELRIGDHVIWKQCGRRRYGVVVSMKYNEYIDVRTAYKTIPIIKVHCEGCDIKREK